MRVNSGSGRPIGAGQGRSRKLGRPRWNRRERANRRHEFDRGDRQRTPERYQALRSCRSRADTRECPLEPAPTAPSAAITRQTIANGRIPQERATSVHTISNARFISIHRRIKLPSNRDRRLASGRAAITSDRETVLNHPAHTWTPDTADGPTTVSLHDQQSSCRQTGLLGNESARGTTAPEYPSREHIRAEARSKTW